ncbi:MAG: hypothetical protein EOP34_03410 [Rickettsiales bacterium]|nr:MAG: hypothetical protein EOP34_03410 [Rickettsiales bacterium]
MCIQTRQYILLAQLQYKASPFIAVVLIFFNVVNKINNNMLISLIDILVVIVPVLITVAYITLLERKVLASMQRRVGPDTVGVFGILQPFADALKLLVKEIVVPQQAQTTLFLLAPSITLISALIG